MYGHLHGVSLDHHDGGAFVTLDYSLEMRETCELWQGQGVKDLHLKKLPTPVTATPEIVTAFNQGMISHLRSDPEARAVRQGLFTFLEAHIAENAIYSIIADDLRRHASIPLCADKVNIRNKE